MNIRIIAGLFLFSIITGSIFSCKNKKEKIDVSQMETKVDIIRFDQLYQNADRKTFPELKAQFYYFFPGHLTDDEWLIKNKDSLSIELYDEVQQTFGDLSKEEKAIEALFKNVKFYYPLFKEPKVISLISKLDMNNQLIYNDTLLILSLDTYLGSGKKYYQNFPGYLQAHFEPSQLTKDIATAIAYETAPQMSYRIFVERIIAAAKIKYEVSQFLPQLNEYELFNYTSTQQKWLTENEENIWRYFIEKDLLYSTDKDLQRRFIDPAPFSKFYLENDIDIPGQAGIWLGLQIIKSYMQHNEVSLPELMATAPEIIFEKSKYKPAK
jgi:uncharacterized protein YjaZ